MSVKVMSQVYTLELGHAEQSILLALADHADDDGTNCYPSVPYIAWKTGYSERQVQRVLGSLEKQWLIQPVAYEQGGRGHATHYHIHLEKGVIKSPFIPKERVTSDAKGDISGEERVTFSTIKGDIAMSPEPSSNHHKEEPSVTPEFISSVDTTEINSTPEAQNPEIWPEWYSLLWGIEGFKTPFDQAEAWRSRKGISEQLALDKAYALRDWWPRQSPRKRKDGNPYATWQNWCNRDNTQPRASPNGKAKIDPTEKYTYENFMGIKK